VSLNVGFSELNNVDFFQKGKKKVIFLKKEKKKKKEGSSISISAK